MTKNEVLLLLRGEDSPVSGQKIAQTLHISRAAVWKAVEALRADGYEIISRPRVGYQLAKTPQTLSAEEIRQRLGTHPWADRVAVFSEVGSTNDVAKQLASKGAPEGTAILAESQHGGKGRLGRRFSSPAGQGIYLSVVLRPKVRPTELMHLTAAAAEAVCEAVEEETGLCAGVKWVNDLVVGGRKLAGILTELSVELESGFVNYVVIGVGINCCQKPSDFPEEIASIATSIRMQTGILPDRNALTAAILRTLSHLGDTLLSEKAEWMRRYEARCITLGKPVQVLRDSGVREAFACGIDGNAALEVEYPDGTREHISSGEVSVRGLYGYI